MKFELPNDMPESAKAIVRVAVNTILNTWNLKVTEVSFDDVSLFIKLGEGFQMVMDDYKYKPEHQSLVLWFNGKPIFLLGGKFNDVL
ncbi:hypothetical protein D3C87_1254400 [compost metagenome]